STTRYCFGDHAGLVGEYAWYSANSGSQTHPVGQLKPNAFDIYDMHGNVWEWCRDWFRADYYKQSVADDPRGPGPAAQRVIRGGSWNHDPQYARSACRNGFSPDYRSHVLGFRLARAQSGR